MFIVYILKSITVLTNAVTDKLIGLKNQFEKLNFPRAFDGSSKAQKNALHYLK